MTNEVIIFVFNFLIAFYRRKEDNTHHGTTWQIKFNLDCIDRSNAYKLRVAIASATLAELQVFLAYESLHSSYSALMIPSF